MQSNFTQEKSGKAERTDNIVQQQQQQSRAY